MPFIIATIKSVAIALDELFIVATIYIEVRK
jgi:hypothetical protein